MDSDTPMSEPPPYSPRRMDEPGTEEEGRPRRPRGPSVTPRPSTGGQQQQHQQDVHKRRSKCRSAGACCAGFCSIVGFLCIVLGILVLVFFRGLVSGVIRSSLVLRSDSAVVATWLSPPVTPLLKLYFFNVTNVDDFLQGSKPKLVEVGPYVYEQKWTKVAVTWSSSERTVEYGQKKTFQFRRDLSLGPESDLITIPNVPMITAIGGKMKYAGRLVRLALASMMDILRQTPFVELSVREVVWGYDHPLIKLGNDILPAEEKLPFDQFGFFTGKNNSVGGLITALTGLENVSDVGQIQSVDGKTRLDFWKTDQCNSIRGTDGSLFHPGVSKNDTLYIFNKDLCQSLPLVFHEEVSVKGVPAYRFVPPSDVFATPEEKPYNDCFCVASEGCTTPSGLFNMSLCQFGSPIMLSWPHFYQADPRLLDTVEGLEPVEEKHQFFLDIQPQLGSSLRAQARTQINVVMNAVDSVKAAEGLRDIIFPIVWFSDGVEELDDAGTITLLKAILFLPEKVRSILYPSLIIIGCLILLIVGVSLLKGKMRQREKAKKVQISSSTVQEMNTYKNGHSGNHGNAVTNGYPL